MTRTERADRVVKLRRIAAEINGRAIDMDALVDAASHLYGNVADRAIRNAIREDLRSGGENGVPWALSVDSHGTYMQTSLMEIEEFRFAIMSYVARAKANRAVALRLAERCREIHGVWINPDEVAVVQ